MALDCRNSLRLYLDTDHTTHTGDEVINTENYRFPWGQYKGRTYNEILEIDPQYIYWCWHSLPEFHLAADDLKALIIVVESAE